MKEMKCDKRRCGAERVRLDGEVGRERARRRGGQEGEWGAAEKLGERERESGRVSAHIIVLLVYQQTQCSTLIPPEGRAANTCLFTLNVLRVNSDFLAGIRFPSLLTIYFKRYWHPTMKWPDLTYFNRSFPWNLGGGSCALTQHIDNNIRQTDPARP